MDGFYTKDGAHYCADDYQRLFVNRCRICGELAEGNVVSVLGDTYHQKCFHCSKCGSVLATCAFLFLLFPSASVLSVAFLIFCKCIKFCHVTFETHSCYRFCLSYFWTPGLQNSIKYSNKPLSESIMWWPVISWSCFTLWRHQSRGAPLHDLCTQPGGQRTLRHCSMNSAGYGSRSQSISACVLNCRWQCTMLPCWDIAADVWCHGTSSAMVPVNCVCDTVFFCKRDDLHLLTGFLCGCVVLLELLLTSVIWSYHSILAFIRTWNPGCLRYLAVMWQLFSATFFFFLCGKHH